MAADLSYLFNEVKPSGMMAGVQQGISNARSLMDLEKLGADTRTQEFELDKNKQMLPYELQIKKGLGAQGEQDASQPALDARAMETKAKAEGSRYDTWKKILSMPTDKLNAYFAEQHTQMKGTIDRMTELAASGASGKDLVLYLDRMSEKLSPEQQAIWKQPRSKYMMYSSGQAYQELMKMQEGINNMSPEMLKEKTLQQGRMELARLEGGYRVGAAKAGQGNSVKNSSPDQEVVNLLRNKVARKEITEDEARIELERYRKELLSSTTGMGIDPVTGMPISNKTAGGGQQTTKPMSGIKEELARRRATSTTPQQALPTSDTRTGQQRIDAIKRQLQLTRDPDRIRKLNSDLILLERGLKNKTGN